MMALTDSGIYVAILATVGWVPAAVTTEARLIKVGNRLTVAEIGIRSDGAEELVAHATGTYSIPAV